MKKVYYLSTCSTCQRILSELNLDKSVELQDIKTNKISHEQLEEMKRLAGNYEALFSKRSMKYRSMGLNNKVLNENDFKELILQEYTFLKRPVFILGESIFIGNSKKVVEDVKKQLNL